MGDERQINSDSDILNRSRSTMTGNSEYSLPGGPRLQRTPPQKSIISKKIINNTGELGGDLSSTENKDKETNIYRTQKRQRMESPEMEAISTEATIKVFMEKTNNNIEQIKQCTNRELNGKISFTKADRAKVSDCLENIKEEIMKIIHKTQEIDMKEKQLEIKLQSQREIIKLQQKYEEKLKAEMEKNREITIEQNTQIKKEIREIKQLLRHKEQQGYDGDSDTEKETDKVHRVAPGNTNENKIQKSYAKITRTTKRREEDENKTGQKWNSPKKEENWETVVKRKKRNESEDKSATEFNIKTVKDELRKAKIDKTRHGRGGYNGH